MREHFEALDVNNPQVWKRAAAAGQYPAVMIPPTVTGTVASDLAQILTAR